MGLKIKNIVNIRNGLIDFINSLQSNVLNAKFKEFKIDSIINYFNIDDVKLKILKNEIKSNINELRSEYVIHYYGLISYLTINKFHFDMIKCNCFNDENNPFVTESKLNINVHEFLLTKIGINENELIEIKKIATLFNNERRDVKEFCDSINKIINEALLNSYIEKLLDLIKDMNIELSTSIISNLYNEFSSLLNMDNLELFSIQKDGYNQNNRDYYDLLSYEGINVLTNVKKKPTLITRTLQIESPITGYCLDKKGIMVPYKGGSFLTRFMNAISRMFNSNQVVLYNEDLNYARKVCNDKDIIEEMNENE